MLMDRNGLEVLDRSQCLALLATASLGRLALTAGALPTVLPVNFCLHDDRVLVRSGVGSKLDAALRNAVVAFEVDDFDPVFHSGWSVVVTGVAEQVDDPDVLAAAERLPLARWAPFGDAHLVAISTAMITGRRVDPAVSATSAARSSAPSSPTAMPG